MPDSFLANYAIPLLTIIVALLTVVGTIYILRSILLNISLRESDQAERLRAYIKYRFDIKWSLIMSILSLAGGMLGMLMGDYRLLNLNAIFFVLFVLLYVGNMGTLKVRTRMLERITEQEKKRFQ